MARPVKRENLQMTVKKAQRREPPTDYLKFFKVARYWAKRKYELSGAEVDMLLFSWDTRIFHTLLKNGWIVKWREPYKTRHALYELSFKGKRLVSDIYKKCSGEDDYSLIPHRNPCFDRKNANYMDKVYSSQMLKINQINRDSRLKPVKIRPPHRGG